MPVIQSLHSRYKPKPNMCHVTNVFHILHKGLPPTSEGFFYAKFGTVAKSANDLQQVQMSFFFHHQKSKGKILMFATFRLCGSIRS